MKHLYKFSIIAAALLGLNGCKKDVPDVRFTDIGPAMTVSSYDETAWMGGKIYFNVDLKDEFPLSTLKAKLLFDEAVVSEKTIRTKEYGAYAGFIDVPLYANIPDGTATLVLTAQNTGLGITEKTMDVAVSRPDFETMTLHVDGKEYSMAKVADYQYSIEDVFPASAAATITSPAYNDKGDVITIGWDGAMLAAGNASQIPFSAVKQGVYTITANLLDLSASPFGKTAIILGESAKTQVLHLLQGTAMNFLNISGIGTWDMDYDFFDVAEDNTVTFKAVDGLYRLVADFGKKFIKVEAMEDAGKTASLAEDGTGAIWMIGSNFGKPSIGPSWNTDDGAYCFSQVSAKVYRMTLTAGGSIGTNGFSVKAFHQKGWGGEFGGFAAVNDETGLFAVSGSGNIEPAEGKSLKAGDSYSFEIDCSEGPANATLHIFKADVPVKSLDITVNGVTAERRTATLYTVLLDLQRNDAITVAGQVQNLGSWWMDPDFLKLDGSTLRFNAMSGKYLVSLHLEEGYASFQRMKTAEAKAEIADHALWMMGWGLASPVMTSQFGFTPGASFCMAEVEDMVFQLTGTAVVETDGTTMGGRFRADYISAKYFGQDGWGNECGKILGAETTVKISDRASALLKMDGTNFALADDVQLELGATYVLRIDLSKAASDGVETIDFYKK